MAADIHKLFPIQPAGGTFVVPIGDDIYTVERMDRGYGRVTDESGEIILLYPLASIPDAMVPQMLVVWRAGHDCGMRRGLARGIKIAEDKS